MRVNNPDRSPFAIHSCGPAQTPSDIMEIVGDDLPVFDSGYLSELTPMGQG